MLWKLLALGAVPALASAPEVPIHGEVRSATGPLHGAEVALLPILSHHEDGLLLVEGVESPEPVALSRTDSEGVFRLLAPRPGMWRVRVAHPGLAPRTLDLVPLLEETDLPPLRLVRSRKTEVRVLSHAGEAIRGARVLASAGPSVGTPVASGPIWSPARQLATTDAKGLASISGVPEEALRIGVAADGYESRGSESVRGPTWSVRLRSSPVRMIEVVDRARRAAENVLISAPGFELPLGKTDVTGRHAVSLPPGHARLRLLAADGAALEASWPPPKDSDPGAVRLQLKAPLSFHGRVLGLPDREPIASALVWRSHSPGGAVEADEQGGYRLPLLPWYEGALRVAAPGHLPDQIGWDTPIRPPDGPTLVLHPAGTIVGVVTDSDDQPLAGVAIRTRFDSRALGPLQINTPFWQRQSGGVARTRKRGRFRVGNLIPGLEYQLRVELEGFSPAQVPVSVPRKGETVREVRIALQRGIRAGGRVVDPQKRPIAGARVTLTQAKPADVLDQIRRMEDRPPHFVATTDTAGDFELAALPTGELDLEAEAQGFASATVPRIELEGLGRERVDLGTITLSPEAVVNGRVVDPGGAPLAAAAVTIVPENPYLALAMDRSHQDADAISASDGTFEIGGLRFDQSVKLRVDLPGYAMQVVPVVRAGGEPVRVVLAPARALRGTVVDSERMPVAAALVVVSNLDHVKLSGGQIVSAGKPTSLLDRTGDDGRFLIERVPPGPVDILVEASGWQRWERRLDPWSEGQDGEVEVVLQAAAVIGGTVLDAAGQPAIGAEVRTWEPEAPAGGIHYRAPLATTDGDGAYRIDDLAPGTTRLEARHPALGRALREVVISPGETVVDFQLQAAGRVSGRVVDRFGAPVAGASIVVRSQRASWVPPRVESDGTGSFEIAGLSAGIYALEATKRGEGRSLQPVTFELRDEPLDDLVVEIAPAGAVSGRLFGLALEELSEVRLHAGPLLDVGAVDHEGHYRIPGLSPGTWTIVAEIPRTGRTAMGRVELDVEEPETRLDLEFGTGLILSGTVTATGEPRPGAAVTAFGPGGIAAWTETDGSGSFRLSGLEEGDYIVEVVVHDRDAHYREVRLDSDRTVLIDLNAAASGNGVRRQGRP